MNIGLEKLFSSLWEEFDGTTGLAILFLLGIILETGQGIHKIVILPALIIFATIKGLVRSMLRDKDYDSLEEGFGDLLQEFDNMYEVSRWGKSKFWFIMISSTILILIELYALFLGAYLWIITGSLTNPLVILIWIYLLFKFFFQAADLSQSEAVREYIVRFNRKTPGTTFWPEKKNKSE